MSSPSTPSTASTSFQRRERGGIVVYGGRDHLSAVGWWVLVAVFGGGAAFLMLDKAGWTLTGAVLALSALLGRSGQQTGRFHLRLDPAGPILSYSLLGVRYRRWLLPRALRARVMGLGDWGDEGTDGQNVATELFLEGHMLDELWVGSREDAPALCAALQADLQARYGSAAERIERLQGNFPWVLRPLRWAQRRLGILKPRVARTEGCIQLDIPTAGLEAEPSEAALWLVFAALSGAATAVTVGLGSGVWTWVAAAVFTLSCGVLAWRLGRSLRVVVASGSQVADLYRRRFGVVTWQLRMPYEGST